MLSQNTTDFNELIESLKTLNSKENMGDIAQNCLKSLQKLKLARKFSKIDEQIFQLGLNKIDANKSDFFTELLYLETKRLKFKEESIKCLEKPITIKTQMMSK